jgi:hypothetical protein
LEREFRFWGRGGGAVVGLGGLIYRERFLEAGVEKGWEEDILVVVVDDDENEDREEEEGVGDEEEVEGVEEEESEKKFGGTVLRGERGAVGERGAGWGVVAKKVPLPWGVRETTNLGLGGGVDEDDQEVRFSLASCLSNSFGSLMCLA